MVTRVNGPTLSQLEKRAEYISDQVTGAFDAIVLEVSGWYDSFDDINITRALWLERVNTTLLPLVMQAYDDSATDMWENLNGVDTVDETALTAATIPRIVSDLADQFFKNSKRRLVMIGDMLWDAMRLQLLQGTQLSETTGALRERLPVAAHSVLPRARNVAKTEVIGASNAGSYHQMKVANIGARKTWIARKDDRTRQSHRDVDGMQVDVNAKFIVGGYALDYPHDPTAPPEEVYNCRCRLVWEIVDKGKLNDEPVVRSLTADGAEVFHLPGQHDQDNHGRHHGDNDDASDDSDKFKDDKKRIAAILSAYGDGYEVIRSIESSGSGATMDVLRLSDGTEIMRKIASRNGDGERTTRREYLGGRVLNAAGVHDVHTAKLDNYTLLTTLITGPSGARELSREVPDDLPIDEYNIKITEATHQQVTAPGGKAIGLADWLMGNIDRHSFNWIMSSDGVKPIDQGEARFTPVDDEEGYHDAADPLSPFSSYWLDITSDNDGQITSMRPRVTADEFKRLRERVESLSSEFSREKSNVSFENMMLRLDYAETRLAQ